MNETEIEKEVKPTEKRIFFREIDLRPVVEKYNKWKETDHRRKLLAVKFNDGSVWYPKDDDLRIIEQGKDHVHKHNFQFENIDPKLEVWNDESEKLD